MANIKYINIEYPYKISKKGYYFELTNNDVSAIKSDIIFLLLTQKGERLYNPDFGTNLLKYIFEPNDFKTSSDIKEEISTSLKKYIPNLVVNEINIKRDVNNPSLVTVRLDYIVNEDTFQESDFIELTLRV